MLAVQATDAVGDVQEDEQDLAGSAPPTTAQTQPQAPSGSAKPEIASTAEQQKAVSQDTPKPAETTQEAVSTATTNADITASTPSKAGEGTLGKAVNKKRPVCCPLQFGMLMTFMLRQCSHTLSMPCSI